MPLSQMLLLRIFPKERAALATVIWAMTTRIGPLAGPILGGIICDNYGWSWIFFIKVPIAAAGDIGLWWLLRGQADPKMQAFIDKVGLILLERTDPPSDPPGDKVRRRERSGVRYPPTVLNALGQDPQPAFRRPSD